MEANPYENSLDVEEPASPLIPGFWLAVAVSVNSLLAGVSIAMNEGMPFFVALFVGIPIISFMAGYGRSRNPVATAGAGIFIAIAGIIAFLPVCGTIGTLSGMGLHATNHWTVSSLVCGGSIGIAGTAVVWMHKLRGVQPTGDDAAK